MAIRPGQGGSAQALSVRCADFAFHEVWISSGMLPFSWLRCGRGCLVSRGQPKRHIRPVLANRNSAHAAGGLDAAWAREIRHKSLSVTTEPGGPRLVGEAMQVTDDPRMTILSELADVRDVPLADMPALGLVTHHLVERAAPGLLITSAPAASAAFQSAI